ncbi:MAG: PHP domain-containing protein [Chloroflexi bacterium]|nr:PHP domain-containing protein [Chloroflexota bacterium]
MTGTIVDMHVHTVRGAADSSLKPEQLSDVAKEIGLTGVNITEHDRMWDEHVLKEFREESGLFVNRGMEVSTDMGHILAVGLTGYVPGIRKAKELRLVLDDLGGFMIVAHPFRHFFDPIHFRREGRPPFDMTPEEAAERMSIFGLVDDIEVANGGTHAKENQFALKVARVLGKRGVGASDCHSTQGVGYFVTVFEEELRDEAHMLEQLHAGRYYAGQGLPSGELRRYELEEEGVSTTG